MCYSYHLPFDHLGLFSHAETPVVVGPLRAVVWLASGRVDGRPPLTRRTASSAPIMASAPAPVVTSTSTTTRNKGLSWESSIPSTLNFQLIY